MPQKFMHYMQDETPAADLRDRIEGNEWITPFYEIALVRIISARPT